MWGGYLFQKKVFLSHPIAYDNGTDRITERVIQTWYGMVWPGEALTVTVTGEQIPLK